MKISTSALAKCLLSAAMLSGLGAMAQTTVPAPTPTPTPTPTTQTAPTQDFATDLANANLAKQGIKAPTTEQLAAAVKNIQDQRASGLGWGQIANSLGLKMGDVVSAENRSAMAGTAGSAGTGKAGAAGGMGAGAGGTNAGSGSMGGSAGSMGGSAGGMGAGGGGTGGSHGGMGGSAGGKK